MFSYQARLSITDRRGRVSPDDPIFPYVILWASTFEPAGFIFTDQNNDIVILSMVYVSNQKAFGLILHCDISDWPFTKSVFAYRILYILAIIIPYKQCVARIDGGDQARQQITSPPDLLPGGPEKSGEHTRIMSVNWRLWNCRIYSIQNKTIRNCKHSHRQ